MTPKYDYKPLPRVTDENGKRRYTTPDGNKLPSVTTILDATTDKSFLFEWKKKVGNKKAQQITNASSSVGTYMHDYLEKTLLGEEPTPSAKFNETVGHLLANSIIHNGFDHITETWGLEAPLYFEGLYAGTTDFVGMWKCKPAIIDFKNTRKPKKKEYIENYFIQLAAYAMAHDNTYGTQINTGVILMAAREEPYLGEYQEFVIEGNEFKNYKNMWMDRVEQYYNLNK